MNTYELVGYIFIFGAFLVTLIADILLRTRYRKYRRLAVASQISGAEAARTILQENGLEDVYVIETKGYLTDHYDPSQKVIRLSSDIYHGQTIAAVSVAAHECGHALQDKEGYIWLRFRSFLIPLVNFGTRFGYISILIGLFFQAFNLAWIGVSLLIVILLFQLITLPVEIDASERGKRFLSKYKIITSKEKTGSTKMLAAAAMTYVAALLSTIADVLRLVLVILNNERD
mgnify:FL=1